MYKKSTVLKSQIWDLNLVLNLYNQSKFIDVRRRIWSLILKLRRLPSIWQLDSLNLPDNYIDNQLCIIRKDIAKIIVPDKLRLERKYFWKLWQKFPRYKIVKIQIDDRTRWNR